MYIRDQNSKNQSGRIKPPENYGGTVFLGGELKASPETRQRPGTFAETEPPKIIKDSIPGHQIRPNFAKEGGHDSGREPPPAQYREGVSGSHPGKGFEGAGPADDDEPGEYCPLPRRDDRAGHAPPHVAEPVGLAPPAPKEKEAAKNNPLKSLFSSIMPPGIGGRRDDGEFGFEELLIIGLILLLSQSESDNDVLLILALLLFF